MGKPVIYAHLHTGFFIPGMKQGNFTDTLPPTNKTLTNFRMTLEESGALFLQWEEGKYTTSFTVGAANVKGVKHPAVLTNDLIRESEVKAKSKKNS